MSVPEWCQSALLLVTIGSAGFWLVAGFQYYAGARSLPGLLAATPLPDAALPSATIVSAAKDEEEHAREAVRSLLAQDYPDLRLVAVDDRSADRTGAILDDAAARDSRLRVLHVRDLPSGWLGKCHALALAAREADGEWILFTDGDVQLAPDALRRAVSIAVQADADHLAVAPDLRIEGIGEAAFVGFFVSMFNISQRPWKTPDPRSRAAVGVGAFNLVRTAAYDRAGGHERLRMELLDDMGLSRIIKRSGGRSMFAMHDGMVRARWHAGVRGLIRGVEKNAFPALRYDVAVTVASVTALLAVSVAPVAGLLAPSLATKAAAILAWSGVFLVYSVTGRVAAIRLPHALLMPVGALLFCYAILHSMTMTLAKGGVVWRGTFYPLEQLRRG